jgi:hypothetical protein
LRCEDHNRSAQDCFSRMAAAITELFRVSAENAACVDSKFVSGVCIPDAQLDELAKLQRLCLDAFHTCLHQKVSSMGLMPSFISRRTSHSQTAHESLFCDFSDNSQCMRYAVRCCEESSTAEHMRQLAPVLRCLQRDAPNSIVFMPLFVEMGGLTAILMWAKRIATQLTKCADRFSAAVLTGVLQIISKFHVLPNQTVPSGCCQLLLDVMGCRLPRISTCAGAVLKCWMVFAQKHDSSSIRCSGTTTAVKSNLESPLTRSASLPPVVARCSIPRGSSAHSCPSRSADSGANRPLKLVAELCDDDAEVAVTAQRGKRPCSDSRVSISSKRPAASTRCDALQPTPSHHHSSSASNSAFAPGSFKNSAEQCPPPSVSHASDILTAVPNSAVAPVSFNAFDTAQAFESLASILQQDDTAKFAHGANALHLQHTQAASHRDCAAALEENDFAELFAPPALQHSDFFINDDQFYGGSVVSSSTAVTSAFLEALQQFNQRDELSGLQSLCSRYGR